MLLGLFFAILSPLCWSVTNIVDKLVVTKRVKDVIGYVPVVGFAGLSVGIILSLFLDWSAASFSNLVFPVATGLIGGMGAYVYYFVMKHEDVSHVVGLFYIYPVFVAIAAYALYGETIPALGYAGMTLATLGVLWLSWRANALSKKSRLWMIIIFIAIIVVQNVLMKEAITRLPIWENVAANSIGSGTGFLLGLVIPRVRRGFVKEVHNAWVPFVNEAFAFSGMAMMYAALATVPLTIVSAIGTIQPLAVLFLERAADAFGHKLSKEHLLLPKLGPILLIVAGVALLAVSTA